MRLSLAVRVGMLAFLWGASTASAAEGPYAWRWAPGEHRTFYVENEVLLPLMMWFKSDYNEQARITAWQTKAVIDCEATGETKKGFELRCQMKDFSLKAAAVPADAGLVNPIVAQMDEKISKASLQVVISRDGRVGLVDLENIDIRNRRISTMRENMRLVLSRMVFALDLRLPKAHETGNVWDQSEARLFSAPSPRGTQGAADTIHRAAPVADGRVRIETAGRGIVMPTLDGTNNLYDTTLEADALFDPAAGAMVRRVWTLRGEPTASSAISENGAGIPYIQRGRLVLLSDGVEAPPVGDSVEMAAPGTTVTTLQQWESLGL